MSETAWTYCNGLLRNTGYSPHALWEGRWSRRKDAPSAALPPYGQVHEHGHAYGDGDGIEQYHAPVRRFLESLCRDGHLAEDLAQETYLRAYIYLARNGRTIERPRSWLFTIARCVYVDHVRYRAIRPEVSLESFNVIAEAEDKPSSTEVETQEERDRLGRAIDELDGKNRALVVGFHIKGEDLRDLAVRYGLSPGTARVRLYRARRRLRRHLE